MATKSEKQIAGTSKNRPDLLPKGLGIQLLVFCQDTGYGSMKQNLKIRTLAP
jgi:hypothetical protein